MVNRSVGIKNRDSRFCGTPDKLVKQDPAQALFGDEGAVAQAEMLVKLCLIADCMPEIKTLLTTIASQPQLEGIALVKYCDAQGNATGFAGTVLNEDTNTTTTLYFDANLQPIATAPSGVPCPEKDIELKTFGPIVKCDINGAKYYGFYCKLFVNGLEQSQNQFWILPNGTTTATMPAGLLDCNLNTEIIAFHDRYHVVKNASSVPAGYEGFDFDLPVDYGTTDATDTYLHVLYLSTGYYYPPATTNPTTPILIAGNEVAINTFIQNSLIADGLTGNELVLVVNGDNTITIWKDPAYTPTGNEFWLGPITPDQYTNKFFPVIQTTHTAPTGGLVCNKVQQIKDRNTITGVETYRYITEDGNGNLVKAESIIAGFSETNVVNEFPIQIKTVETCTSDNANGLLAMSFYADKNGNICMLGQKGYKFDGGKYIDLPTGVSLVECACDTVATLVANRKGNSYGGSIGHSYSGNTINERVFTDGLVYDSLASSSGGLAGSPRNHHYRVRVFNGSGTLVSTTVLGGYGIDISGATYNQFLSDLSALTSQFGVTFTDTHPNNTSSFGFEMEYNDTTYFGITFEHGFDNHAGGIDWNIGYKSAIKYQSGDAQPFDSIMNSGDLNNPFADVGFREWTNMWGVYDLENIVTI